MKFFLQCLTFHIISIASFAVGHTVTISQTNVLCNSDCNGTASAIVSGGVGPFVYSWSNGATGISTSGLCAATYSCTVTDNNDLSEGSDTIVIVEPLAIEVLWSINPATCVPGSATLYVTGGVSPYTYTWNTGAIGNTITSYENSYTVTVTDNNGCTKMNQVTIHSGEGYPIVILSQKDVSCSGGNDGNIYIDGSGANTYSWSNGAIGDMAINLSAGFYTVTRTDYNGYQVQKSIFVSEPPPIVITTTISNAANCKANESSVEATVSGGNGAFTYAWSNGSSGISANNLVCSTYTLSVTDKKNCTATTVVSVSDVVGIEQYDINFQLQVSPNPSNGIFTVKSGSILKNALLVDVLGNIVYFAENVQSTLFEVTLMQHSNGIYF